jgi:hypothetical protein
MRRPVDRHDVLRGQEFSGRTIEHVEEAVLRRLHNDFAQTAIDLEIGQDHMLNRGVVPGVARHRLIVPHVIAGIGSHGDDRSQEQVVATAGAPQRARPRRTIADADVQEIQFGIEGEGVPRSATSTLLPPFPGPGLRRHLHGGIFESLGWVTGHGVEAPYLIAGGRVVSCHIAPDAILGAAVTNDYLVFDDPRRACDRVPVIGVRRLCLPDDIAGLGLERDETPVERADIDATFPHRCSAVLHAAARLDVPLRGNLRVELPQ